MIMAESLADAIVDPTICDSHNSRAARSRRSANACALGLGRARQASNWQNSLAGDALANAFLKGKMGAKGTGSIIQRENRA
jgi:hypothetical protein